MSPEFFGGLSAAIIALSAIPYGLRAWQRKTEPNVISWVLWTGIGLAMFLTYYGAGANIESMAPLVFGFVNPLIIAAIAWIRIREREPLSAFEWAAVVFGTAAIIGWYRLQGTPEHVAYALLLAIVADACAAVPTLLFVWKHPMKDRPGAWMMFAAAQLIMLLSIADWTWSSYLLPIYLFLGAAFISLPMIFVRLRSKTPLRDWI